MDYNGYTDSVGYSSVYDKLVNDKRRKANNDAFDEGRLKESVTKYPQNNGQQNQQRQQQQQQPQIEKQQRNRPLDSTNVAQSSYAPGGGEKFFTRPVVNDSQRFSSTDPAEQNGRSGGVANPQLFQLSPRQQFNQRPQQKQQLLQQPQQPLQLEQRSKQQYLLKTPKLSQQEESPQLNMADNNYNYGRQATLRRGQLVTFYRNGDPHFKGLKTSVSSKMFATLETLLVWLNDKIHTSAGVKYIFCLPEGTEMRDVTQFIGGRSYVVSSVHKIIHVPYGESKERFWRNRSTDRLAYMNFDSGSPNGYDDVPNDIPAPRNNGMGQNGIRSSFVGIPPNQGSPQMSPVADYTPSKMTARPRILLITSNTDRTSQQKVIFNPQTSQSFENVLADIKNMVKVEFPPVTGLYTATKPYTKVLGITHLTRELKDINEFLACGREGVPLELQEEVLKAAPKSQLTLREAMQETDSQPSERYVIGEDLPDAGSEIADDAMYEDVPTVRGSQNVRMIPKTTQQPIRPYRKARPDAEQVKVYIHGHLREFFAPRYATIETDSSQLDKKLALTWVYGYRGRDSGNNLFAISSNTLLYYVASVAIVYNKETDKQKLFISHTEDITCMAVHPSTTLVATGQLAGKTPDSKARVLIWDPASMATVAELGQDMFVGGISSVSFSNKTVVGDGGGRGVRRGGAAASSEDGSYLLAVDEGPKHTLYIWDWRSKRLIAKTATVTSDDVVWAAFHPLDQTIVVTYGRQHLHFWKLFLDGGGVSGGGDGGGGAGFINVSGGSIRGGQGRILRDKLSGIFEVDTMPNFVTSLAFATNGDVITGDSNGRITVWNRDNAAQAFLASKAASNNLGHGHEKPVFSLCMLDDGTLLSGGGSDVKAWDSLNQYRPVKERTLSDSVGYVRTLVPATRGGADGAIYIGTTNNTILFGSLQSKFTAIVQGHSEELWAIANHPVDPIFVTAGYDQCVTQWHADTHKPIWSVTVEKPCVSVDFDSAGKFVVVGTTVGRFIVLEASTGSHIVSVQVGTESLDTIKFSPDGTFLAVGSQDTRIHIYEALDECQVFRRYKAGFLQGHDNFVSHLDWSRDGKFLQSVSGDYDLLFWNVTNLQAVPAEEVLDVAWSTQNCILGYDVIGPWSNLKDGGDINTVARSAGGQYLAVGDNRGALSLYKYPSTLERPEGDVHKMCTGHVTKASFTADDRFLITSGGVDAGVMQWEVVDTRSA